MTDWTGSIFLRAGPDRTGTIAISTRLDRIGPDRQPQKLGGADRTGPNGADRTGPNRTYQTDRTGSDQIILDVAVCSLVASTEGILTDPVTNLSQP